MSDIKSTPTAGYRYRVVEDDSFHSLEKAAYGYVTGTLEKSNPFVIGRNRSPDTGRLYLYPGDIATIPRLAERQTVSKDLQGKDPESMTLVLNDIEIPVVSMRVIQAMDTFIDVWTAEIQWNVLDDEKIYNAVQPQSFATALVYIGNKLSISGYLYSRTPNVTKEGRTLTLEGASYGADILDSNMIAPFEATNTSLLERANQLIAHTGLKCYLGNDADQGGVFDKVTADAETMIGDHLIDLASQRGLMFHSDSDGNLVLDKPNTDAVPVGTIESGGKLPIGWGASFDDRQLFNQITAIGESPGAPAKKVTITDDNVPKSRFITFQANETIAGDIEQAAKWKRTKQFSDALTFPFPVKGFYAPDGNLWQENTTVEIVSPEVFIPNGFTFLIKQVEFVYESSGLSTTLSVLPPSVYNGGDIVLPWGSV